jgi:hypothetical protein
MNDQLHDARLTIERELEEFELKKEQHRKRYGPSRPTTSPGESHPIGDAADSAATQTQSEAEPLNNSSIQQAKTGHEKEQQHDETGDVVDEDGEDMVIY